MDVATFIAAVTGSLINLLATLRQSRCTDIQSECCYGLLKLDLEREVVDTENEV